MKTPTGVEYKQEVIKLFKSGEATEEQWHQMSAAVLEVSLSGHPRRVEAIDYSLLFEEHLMAKTGRSINTVIAEVQAGRDRGEG